MKARTRPDPVLRPLMHVMAAGLWLRLDPGAEGVSMSPVAGDAADASPGPPPEMVTPPSGLNDVDVSRHIAAGQTNATDVRTSRSLAQIVRANVLTVFNGLLAALFVLTMATQRWQNGLFGVVIVVNAGIGIVQEWRAKRTLDRLALVNAPRARVVRNGSGHTSSCHRCAGFRYCRGLCGELAVAVARFARPVRCVAVDLTLRRERKWPGSITV